MRKWAASSARRLDTCSPEVRAIHNASLQNAPYDYAITCGHRGEAEQEEAYLAGKSDLRYGESDHNREVKGEPSSDATDMAVYFAGRYWYGDENNQARAMVRENQQFIKGVALGMGHRVEVMPTLKNGTEDLGHMSLVRDD